MMKASAGDAVADRAAFESAYNQFGREVWSLLYARCMDSQTAMDLTQEAFLRLWRQMQEGTLILNPRAWLFRVGRNLAEDHAKSAFHKNGTQAPQTMESLASKQNAPLEGLEREETLHRVRHELALLSEPDREILTLRYALDYENQKIAEILGIAVTAVHMRLSRARQRLQQRLSDLSLGAIQS